MKMNQENMKRFEEMVRDWASDNNLVVEFNQRWDIRETGIRFKELETHSNRDVRVTWDNKKSLSQAGAAIFSYIIREFDLDGRLTFAELKIKDVIFNEPATIVLWEDGTKTVVKCQDGDVYSKELGLAMCISKKALGNKGNFNDIFKKWVPEPEVKTISMATDAKIDVNIDAKAAIDAANDYLDKIFDELRKKVRGIV